MRAILSLTLLSFIAAGCGLLSPGDKDGKLTATLTVTDTTGKPATQFYSGEPFDVSFFLRNTRSDSVSYGMAGSIPLFEIYEGNVMVSSSNMGCPVPQIVISGSLPPGDTLRFNWRAPSGCTPITLSPGSYQITSRSPGFDTSKVNPAQPIGVSIIQ